MCKKLLLIAVVGAAAFVGLKGTKFFGLAKQEVESARAWLDDQVPVEKEIKRLRKEVQSLENDRAKVADVLAKEIVEVRYLREDVEKMRADVGARGELIQAKADQLRTLEADKKDGTERTQKLKYGKAIVTLDEAKDLLATDVAHFKNQKATLANQEKALSIRERNRENLEKQLDTLKRQKEELAVQIDAFEAEWRAMQLEQMQSKHQADDTRLAAVKQSLRNLEKKLAVEREKLNMAPRLADEAGKAGSKSVDEIMAPLAPQGKPETKVPASTD